VGLQEQMQAELKKEINYLRNELQEKDAEKNQVKQALESNQCKVERLEKELADRQINSEDIDIKIEEYKTKVEGLTTDN